MPVSVCRSQSVALALALCLALNPDASVGLSVTARLLGDRKDSKGMMTFRHNAGKPWDADECRRLCTALLASGAPLPR